MKAYGKHVLSSLISIVLLCIIVFPGILIGASGNSQNILIDFEKYKLAYPQTSYRGVSLTKDAYEGKKALNVKFSESTGFEGKHFILSQKKEGIKLEKNSIYNISFYYKISNLSSCNIDFDIYLTLEDSPLAAKYRKTLSKKSGLITPNTEPNKWIKYETKLYVYGEFIKNKDKICDCLAFGINPFTKNSEIEIVFDNIAIKYEGKTESCTINYNSMGGSAVNSTDSYKGDKINWPNAPTKEGYTFAGWYTDETCETLYREKYYKSNITLYAKWVETNENCVLINFDDAGYGTKAYKPWGDPYTELSSDYYTSQRQSMRYHNIIVDGVRRTLYKPDGSTVNISGNTLYKVTFDYQILSGTGGIQFYSFAGTNTSDANDYYEFTLTQNEGWATATYFFYAQAYDSKTYSLGIRPYSESNSYRLDVVIDNIKIEKIKTTDETVVIFNNNDGQNSSYVSGEKGTNIEPPVPQRTGYIFNGWYEKLSTLTSFNDTKFEMSKNVFGRWSKEVTEQNFETYNSYGRGEGYDMDYEIYRKGTTPDFDSNNVHSGKTSIHRIGAYKGIKSVSMFDYSLTPLTTHESYIFSFWVKLESCNNADGGIYFANTKSVLVGWRFDDKYEAVVKYGELLDGKWHKISFVQKTLLPYAAIFTTGEASLYIDDFSAKWVPEGTVLNSSERIGPGEGEGKNIVVGNHSTAKSLSYLEKYISINSRTTDSNTTNLNNDISGANKSNNGLNNDSNNSNGTNNTSKSKKIIKKIIRKKGKTSKPNIALIVVIASGASVLAGLGGFFVYKQVQKKGREGLEKKN